MIFGHIFVPNAILSEPETEIRLSTLYFGNREAIIETQSLEL